MLAGQCLTPVGVSFVLLVAIASSDLPRFDKRCIPRSELHSEAIFRCPELTRAFYSLRFGLHFKELGLDIYRASRLPQAINMQELA